MNQSAFDWTAPAAEEPPTVTKQLRHLKVDQRFTVELEPGKVVSGRLIYANQCRACVELDGKPQKREFVSSKTDKVVSFTDSGKKKTSWPLELEVEIEGR